MLASSPESPCTNGSNVTMWGVYTIWMGLQIIICWIRALLFCLISACCLLVFVLFVFKCSHLNANLLNEISTYWWSLISKPIQQNPIRVTLCWDAHPAASCCISFHSNSRQHPAGWWLEFNQTVFYMCEAMDSLFPGSLFRFAAFGLASQHLTIHDHLSTLPSPMSSSGFHWNPVEW